VRPLVVSPYLWPETFRLNDLVEGLVARGHEVTVLAGRPNYAAGRFYDAYRRSCRRHSSGMPVHRRYACCCGPAEPAVGGDCRAQLGDGQAAEGVRAEIRTRELTDSVIILGKHPLEQVPSFFRGADALLVSLKLEPTFAMTIPAEVQVYLPAGMPILWLIDGEGARVVEESDAGLACPAGDGVALAGIIERLAGMPAAEREAMGRSS